MRLLLLIALLTGCASTPPAKDKVFIHDDYQAVTGCDRLGAFTTDYTISPMYIMLGKEHEIFRAKVIISNQARDEFNADHVVVSDWDDNFSWVNKIYSTAFRCN